VQKFEFQVEGMNCGHCEMTVKKALQGIEGVKSVLVDLKTGKVKVEAEPGKTSKESLIETIENSGYKASAVN